MRAMAPALNAPAGLTILRCPHCAAAEPVESAELASEARMMRCRQCGGSWPARAPCPAPATTVIDVSWRPLVTYGEPGGEGWAARLLPDEPALAPRRRPWRALQLCLAALTILAVPAVFVAGREAAVAAVPDLAGLYAAIGLPVHRHGLTVEAVKAERRYGDTGAAIEVGGRIVNGGAEERAVPQLVIQFRDAGGLVLHGARAAAPVRRLAPGTSARFLVEVRSVPKEAGHVLVRLGEAR